MNFYKKMSQKPSILSNNEKNFILTTLDENKPATTSSVSGTENKSDSKKKSTTSILPNILRVDGRDLYDYRSIEFSLPTSSQEQSTPSGQVQVTIGNTIALGIVSCSIMEPYLDRPNEGFLTFQIDFSTVGSRPIGTKQTSQQRELCIEIGRVIDRSLRGSRAIDTEALCIIAGRKVWSLRVDVHIL